MLGIQTEGSVAYKDDNLPFLNVEASIPGTDPTRGVDPGRAQA